MQEWLIEHQSTVRMAVFLGLLTVLLVLESVRPRRQWHVSRWWRVGNNLALVMLSTLLLRVLLPVALVTAAAYSERRGVGLLHQVDLPAAIETVLAIVALDLAIYGQHVAMHKVPLLWRFHRVHHTDLDFDVSTGVRFHPVEFLFSHALKLGVIVVLGAPLLAAMLFEVLLNASSLFEHANIRLPAWLDRSLRWVMVTPDMHRVHHSVRHEETDSNYGFNLSCWDRIFMTYRAQPLAGHEGMVVGLEHFDTTNALAVPALLRQPFRAAP